MKNSDETFSKQTNKALCMKGEENMIERSKRVLEQVERVGEIFQVVVVV